MPDDLERRVEPVECAAGHAPVETYVRESFGGRNEYACPTCGRVIALELVGETVERELVASGEFAS